MIPMTAEKKFSEGHLLGTFEGPATSGQEVEIKSGPGWQKKIGRYLIIQINNGTERMYLNLREVFAFGITHVPSNGMLLGSKAAKERPELTNWMNFWRFSKRGRGIFNLTSEPYNTFHQVASEKKM